MSKLRNIVPFTDDYKSLVPLEFHATQAIGFVELEDGIPVGVLLAKPTGSELQILYLYSHNIEDLLDKVGLWKQITLHYREENPFAGQIEQLCKKRGWEGPVLHGVRYLIEIQKLHPAWLDKDYHYARGYSSFPWHTHITLENVPYASSPFAWPEEPDFNSLGLAYEGKTVGWMVTHRISHDTIRYTVLYTYPEYRYRGEIIKLLIESIKKQQSSEVPYAQFDLFTFGIDLRWKEFVSRRLAPYATLISKEYVLWTSQQS